MKIGAGTNYVTVETAKSIIIAFTYYYHNHNHHHPYQDYHHYYPGINMI